MFFPIITFSQPAKLAHQFVPKEISKIAIYAFLEDSYGFIWYGGSGLFKYDGYTSIAYQPVTSDSMPIPFGKVFALLEDKKRNIWVGSSNGLFRYDRKTGQIKRYFSDKLTNRFGKVSRIMSLHEDSAARIWVGGEDKLFMIPSLEGEVIQVLKQLDVDSLHPDRIGGINSIQEDNSGRIFASTINGLWLIETDFTITNHLPQEFTDTPAGFKIYDAKWGIGDTLWLATIEGLWIFEIGSLQFSKVEIPENKEKLVRRLLIDEQNQVWVTGKNQIFVLDNKGRFKRIVGDAHYLLSRLKILSKDRFGNLWLGGLLGLGILSFNEDEKLPFYQVEHDSPYRDNYFYRVMQDSFGGFWFRMWRTGLGYSSSLDAEFEILLQPALSYFGEEVKGICSDVDANVWVITLTQGLFLFEKGQREYRHIDLGDSLRRIAIPMTIIADHQDDRLLWFSSRAGLCSVDRFTYKRKWYYPKKDLPWLDSSDIGMMGQADDGNIWCSLKVKSKSIVGCFYKNTGRFIAERELPGHFYPLRINQFKRVSEGQMWVATDKGLIIIDTKQKTQRFWSKKNGFPLNYPQSITPDKHGNIWFTSKHKIYKYDGQNFTQYNANEKIDEFVNTSSFLTKEGLIAFGGANGLHVFDPQKLKKDTIRPQVYLTDFRVFNKERKLGQAYELVKEITLLYQDNIFSLGFSGLHFSHSKNIRYRYKLEGFEVDWVEVKSNERRATYTNLPPGTYNFKVLAANADGFWSKNTENLNIKITILSPWYRTWWAYLIYIVSFFSLLFFIRQYDLKRKLAKAEAIRLKEIDLAKSWFYTKITHEFRTPLTVILGMAEQVKSDPKKWFNEGLQLIQRNGKQLLGLINQLLDLSKLETGNMPMHWVNGDIVSYLQFISESFHSYADSKDIRVHFITNLTKFYMDYDTEKLQNVVSNLLSNAIKFTPAGGNIYIDLRLGESEEKSIQLQIKDDGMGIESEYLPHIFDRFYQVDASLTRRGEGTGIGLALTKELIKVMGGHIEVESKMGKGTSFTIVLPITQKAIKQELDKEPDLSSHISEYPILNPEKRQNINQRNRNWVLLVEDNKDVLTYLTSFLSNDYNIVTAKDGQEGINKALELIPDLIVSDVMMPEKDGFEVCATLKSDERTSHIPIILLTAKSDQASKIEGLEQGADAYLSKPFNTGELLIRIEKLIALRSVLQKRFQTGKFSQLLKNPTQTKSEAFLKKVLLIIENKLSDENFGMPQLCKELQMDRTLLFRKLIAITGKSATRLIRSMRLEKAKELLETSHLNISEVCFEVGFSSPSYFSREFKKEFGLQPSAINKP